MRRLIHSVVPGGIASSTCFREDEKHDVNLVSPTRDPCLDLQYTSPAAQRYKNLLERDVAKLKAAAAAEEAAVAEAAKPVPPPPSAAKPSVREGDEGSEASTSAPPSAMGNGKTPSVSNLSEAGSVASANGSAAAAAPAGLYKFLEPMKLIARLSYVFETKTTGVLSLL